MRKLLSKFETFFVAFRAMSSSTKGSYKNILTEKYGGVMTIGINRPEKRNAVNPETATELFQAFTDFEEDTESKVAVLYGKGGNFCAGFDLSALANADSSFEIEMPPGQAPMGPSRMCFSKPTIACIDGYAVAGGLELAMLCDMRVVEESAVLGVFCRRFGVYGTGPDSGFTDMKPGPGVPLIDGGTVRLQKLIGLSRAMDLIITGRSVSGKEAYDIGLANRLSSIGVGLSDAVTLAKSLLKYPQKCMNLDRQSAYYAAYSATSLEDALKYEYENGIKVITEESIPGAKSFTEGIGKHGSFKPRKSKL